jgi:AcrR family transcriptional regulator
VPKQRALERRRRAQIIRAAYYVASTKGLDALTVRDVAKRARVSHGLILFHFQSRDDLVIALLDWLLETTTILHLTSRITRIPVALDRFHALLRREMNRLSAEPRRIRLFFEYWTLGIRHRGIRARMRRELARYREAFRPIASEVLRAHPERFRRASAEGLAAVAVSFIKGCAVQSMIDARHFNAERYLVAAQELVGRFVAPAGARARTGAR